MNRKALIAMFFILQSAVIALSAEGALPLDEKCCRVQEGQKASLLDASFFWKKEEAAPAKDLEAGEKRKVLSGTIDAMDLQEAIDEAAKKAVRNEESYMEGLVKDILLPLREEAERNEKEKKNWIKAGLAEGVVIVLEGIAIVFMVKARHD